MHERKYVIVIFRPEIFRAYMEDLSRFAMAGPSMMKQLLYAPEYSGFYRYCKRDPVTPFCSYSPNL